MAVEPNPALARRLRRCFGSSISLEEAALGEKRGTARLSLGRYAGHSTLSQEWATIAGAERWAATIDVRVTTLDELIASHGRPSFIKIDVEGY